MTAFFHSPVTATAIEAVFDAVFFSTHQTVLRGGAAEPFYQPATADAPHCIHYREDFVSSSLHEVAHWLVAGEARRLLPDWGYWYAPDGRDAQQQVAFEQVEVRPQAIEWWLHHACGLPFRVSLDNLGSAAGDGSVFRDAVFAEAMRLQSEGLNARAVRFHAALAAQFGGEADIQRVTLQREVLDA